MHRSVSVAPWRLALGWLGAGGLLAACLPAGPTEAPTPVASPQGPAAVAPSARVGPRPPVGERLLPGGQLQLVAPAAGRRVLLLANPSGEAITVEVAVSPEGLAPSPSPTLTPGPSGRSIFPPFGFGGDRGGWTGLTGLRRLSAAPEAAPVGELATFWINDGSATLEGDRARVARQRLETPNARFFVDTEDLEAVPEDRLVELAEAFERRIRPPLTRVFGAEDRPGVDGDPRLFIVLSDWVGSAVGREGMMGYFWPRDPLPAAPQATDLRRHANEKEVLFLSTRILEQPDVTALGTLAHEYQHLLMFCAKSRPDGVPRTEATWLDEGCSMLAMDLAGLGRVAGDPFVLDEIRAYMGAPGRYSLTDWAGNPDGRSYGLSYMFVRHLTARFGLGLIEELQRTPLTGVKALDAVLAPRGSSAAEAWVDWLREAGEAMVAGEPGRGPTPEALVRSTSFGVRPWGGLYLEAEALGRVPRHVTFLQPSAPLLIWRGVPGDPTGQLQLDEAR